ncbi:MAG: 4Fe-4S dicluster domain-containing protein [Firmicutes bacterium]|nr:4Fe-4S dicluster domain-containing protein [Bacillota bacterium]
MTHCIRIEDLPALLPRLSGLGSIVAPAYEDGVAVLAEVADPSRVAWDFPKTIVPPKELLLPHTDRFLRISVKGRAVEAGEPASPAPVVLFGAKPCDAAAADMLGRVMLEGQFKDESYARRRDSVTIVTVACRDEGPYCFCRSFGLAPDSPRGSDLMLYPGGDVLYAESLTPRGDRVITMAGGLFKDAPGGRGPTPCREPMNGGQDWRSGSPGDGRRLRPAPGQVAAASRRMAADFGLAYWEEASLRCLGCGLCTYLCPTCHCFAVVDKLRGDRVTRSRCWDSCMFEDFSAMAGGHNPRPTTLERVRQRYMHKLVYHAERFGEILCVGCGRCVEKCPVGLHVACVVEEIAAGGGPGNDR